MSLADSVKALFSEDAILDFQLNRKKTEFSQFDRWLFSKERAYHQNYFTNGSLYGEYLHRGEEAELKPISEYPRLEGAVEIAGAPHILGLKEIDALIIFLNQLPQDRYIYTMSKIENFTGIYRLARPLSLNLGLFPIDRENTTRRQLEAFYGLVADPDKAVLVLLTGTRMSSGFGEVNIGLERAVRHGIGDKINHNIIPVSLSYDIFQDRYCMTAGDPVIVRKEDFSGRYKQKGSLTSELESVLKASMKVSFNHLASAYIVTKFNGNNLFDEREMEEELKEAIPRLKARGINIDARISSAESFELHLHEFLNNAYRYIDRNPEPLGPTFAQYEDYIRKEIRKDRLWGLIKGKNYDLLSQSGKNHATEDFKKASPIHYMADMVSHLNLFD
ncbi:hypothetical protein QT06_C0001G0014 [archaeon GW2011_AR15]|nr:hypothetical protein QT06_C0001G0014 [archaeon GW2011_AR15]MBS3104175.1 hypothetical protein [Candidatus Woesearchaeota archaeon]